jgi:membrane-associated phospholipid phosphatase
VKVSLHSAFAAFATTLLWPLVPALVAGAVVTAAVVWSRLVLRRHVVTDVVVGLALGVAAGAAFHLWTAR